MSNLINIVIMKNKYTFEEFWKKIERVADKFGAKIVYCALLLYYTLQDDSVSYQSKVAIVGALAYFIWPFDVIPDFIPGGFADDLSALIATIGLVKGSITESVKNKTKQKMNDLGFGDDNATKGIL